jgi:cytochrome oxidase Cu insertion factor (SCO1/SenC/PrrC family)
MTKLSEWYGELQKEGYEVVSIAADLDEEIYKSMAKAYPLKDKYCDYQGLSGKDFINYNVTGTPTFYLIDEKGIIRGIYARVEDIKL